MPKGKENTFLTEKTKKVKNIKRINIINDEIEGSISLLGARLDDLTLKNYRKTIDPESDKIKFLRKIDEINPYFIQFGWSSPNNQKVPNGNTIWNSSNTILDPKSPIVLTWNNGEGLEFSQEISIDKNFMIKVVQKVKNDTSNPVNLYPYGLIRRAGEPKTTDFFVLHEGPLGVFDGSLKEHSYSDLKESGQKGMSFNTNEKGGWIGITDKYWMAALIPDQKTNSNFTFRYVNNSVSYQTDYLGSLSKIPANSEVKIESRVFSGAKRLDLLDKYEFLSNVLFSFK